MFCQIAHLERYFPNVSGQLLAGGGESSGAFLNGAAGNWATINWPANKIKPLKDDQKLNVKEEIEKLSSGELLAFVVFVYLC